MNQTTTEELLTGAQKLARQYREMADWLDAHPDVPASPGLVHYEFASMYVEEGESQKDVLRRGARAMGKGKKKYDNDYVMVEYTTPSGAKFQLNASREQTCERVQVGTKTVVIPATEERVIEAQPERVEEEPVYEWQCEPLLEPDKEGRT